MRFVDPTTDIAFKKIFGNQAHKGILIAFLNEVLELEYPIADIEILNSYQPPRLEGLKETSLDVKAKDTHEREFIVEMQVEKEAWFCQRALYYSSKSYSQQLGILDFKTFDHDSPFSRHLILNVETLEHRLKDLEFNFIELPKFVKTEKELTTATDKWLYFIQQASDLNHIPENTDIPELCLAYQIAEQHSWTAEELEVYEAQEIKFVKSRNVVETARMKGEQEGLAKGFELAKLEVAQNLLNKMNDEEIALVTGLDLSLIINLRNER